MTKHFLPLVLLLALSTSVFGSAANVWISQAAQTPYSGGGLCNGNNTNAITFFNTAGNWGAGGAQIGAGTTVHLCGIITTQLAFQGGGGSGNPVTLLFESGAKVQITPGANASGAVGLNGNSNITIDGGAGQPCGWNTATNVSDGVCNGQIENMLYGSPGATCPGGTCTTQPIQDGITGTLIWSTGSSNVEIRNIELGPSYIHTTTMAGLADDGGTQCTRLDNGSNYNLHNLKGHDGVWCLVFTFLVTGPSNWTVANNELYNNSHMTAFGGANTANLTGLSYTGNYSHDMSNWDTNDDSNHANTVHLYGTSAAQTISTVTIANNIMVGHMGQNATAQVFLESNGATLTNLQMYNNVFGNTDTASTASERLLFMDLCNASNANCNIYNNTFVGPNTGWGWCPQIGYSPNGTTFINRFQNNIMSNCSIVIDAESAVFATINNNLYGLQGSFVYTGTFVTYATWKTDTGEGAASINSPSGVNLSATYVPNSGSPAIGAGANLTSLGISGLNSDLAGNARPSSAAWDIGAYQFAVSGSISPTTLPSGTVGTNYGTQTLTETGLTGTITWTISSGTLPTGLTGCNSVTGTTCAITGTPTTTVGSPFTFNVHATDGTTTADQSYTVTINPSTGPTVKVKGTTTIKGRVTNK